MPLTLSRVQETDWSSLDARARAVLAAHDGVAHVRAFDAAGITRRQVAALYRRGVLERPRVGWYVDPALPWQVKRAVRVGGVLTCVTAAALAGLPVPPGAHRHLHVHVEAHASHLRHNRDRGWVLATVEDDAEVELHWGDLTEASRGGRTALIDTLVLLAMCVPLEWFVAALDAAVRVPRDSDPMLGRVALVALAMRLPRRMRRALRLVDGAAESPIETLLRLGLVGRGIAFVLQAVVHPAYRVDFLLGGRLVVEVDGAAYHDPEQDRIRDEVLRSLGYRVLRFSYERIVHDLDAVLDEIEAELADLQTPRRSAG